jgi:DNA-directed RNA polymerase subunit RPC12/RpoP
MKVKMMVKYLCEKCQQNVLTPLNLFLITGRMVCQGCWHTIIKEQNDTGILQAVDESLYPRKIDSLGNIIREREIKY